MPLKKKQGGTFFGNIMATTLNKYSGGVLGAKRTLALSNGDHATINPTAKTKSKILQGLGLNTPKTEMEDKKLSSSVLPQSVGVLDKIIGDKAAYYGGRFSENTSFGADDKTLYIIAGSLGLLALAIYTKK